MQITSEQERLRTAFRCQSSRTLGKHFNWEFVEPQKVNRGVCERQVNGAIANAWQHPVLVEKRESVGVFSHPKPFYSFHLEPFPNFFYINLHFAHFCMRNKRKGGNKKNGSPPDFRDEWTCQRNSINYIPHCKQSVLLCTETKLDILRIIFISELVSINTLNDDFKNIN